MAKRVRSNAMEILNLVNEFEGKISLSEIMNTDFSVINNMADIIREERIKRSQAEKGILTVKDKHVAKLSSSGEGLDGL